MHGVLDERPRGVENGRWANTSATTGIVRIRVVQGPDTCRVSVVEPAVGCTPLRRQGSPIHGHQGEDVEAAASALVVRRVGGERLQALAAPMGLRGALY